MQRRALLSSLGAVSLSTLTGCLDQSPGQGGSQTSEQQSDLDTYPAGAGPDSIDFSVIGADEATLLELTHEDWESYGLIYDEPADRPRVEGDYYVDAATGEVISELYNDASDYRDGEEYAYVQPVADLSDHQRERFDEDPEFVYDPDTDTYYRYDPEYGEVAPTNIGRHPTILEPYDWTATGTTTHHGVAVITYRLASEEPTNSSVPPATEGSLLLGVDDGIVYAFDLTLDTDGGARYTYTVRPVAFPDHEWVETAQWVAGPDSGSANASRDAV